jgi:hypothetical protein
MTLLRAEVRGIPAADNLESLGPGGCARDWYPYRDLKVININDRALISVVLGVGRYSKQGRRFTQPVVRAGYSQAWLRLQLEGLRNRLGGVAVEC